MSERDDLAHDRVLVLLATERYGRSLRVLPETESTNDDARRDALAGAPDGHVVVADKQLRGRGSHGRQWSSPAGTDLFLSIVARPRLPLSDLPPLTLAVGLAVADCVTESLRAGAIEAPPEALVKWPNDVWLGGKKCAGILVEAIAQGSAPPALVIGVGLNVNREHWPDELSPVATSMRAASSGAPRFERNAVLARLLLAVERWVDRFVREGGSAVARELDARLLLRGARVRCGETEGILLGVADNGALRLLTDQGESELIAGRVEAL